MFSLPALVVANNARPALSAFDATGFVIWLLGVGGVSLADYQLARFRSDPEHQGKSCRSGLWRYSRHPNYFFEWLHWCSYLLLAVGGGLWWLAAIVPLALLYFLFFVTGIPPTEAQAIASRGDDYREYQRTTSVFVPWFPKSTTTDRASTP